MSSLIVKWDPDNEPKETDMRFRLVYDGPVLATRGKPHGEQPDPRAAHKHNIRRAFHVQLKRFWEQDRFLRECVTSLDLWGESGHPMIPLRERMAELYKACDRRFVPLVVEEFSLHCSLRILFLRREIPGGVIRSGDIDNRIKTIFDALRMPQSAAELFGNEKPADGEDPMYVLLRDDGLIAHAEIETDTLLEPPPPEKGGNDHCRVIVDVALRPVYVNMFNVSFAG